MKKNFRALFGGDFRQFAMIAALLVIVVFFQVFTGGKVLQSQNLMNLIMGNAYVLILAMGMVLVIIAGHIDLSVGSVAAFVGIIVAKLTTESGLPPVVGLLVGLGVGILVGCWQGFWVAQWGIPAFITTLAGMMLFRGANQFIGKSMTVPVPELFQTLGAGYMPDIAPDVLAFNLPTMVLAVLIVAALAWGEFNRRRKSLRAQSDVPPLWVPIVRLVVVGGAILGVMWLFATGRPGTSFPIPGLIVVVLVIDTHNHRTVRLCDWWQPCCSSFDRHPRQTHEFRCHVYLLRSSRYRSDGVYRPIHLIGASGRKYVGARCDRSLLHRRRIRVGRNWNYRWNDGRRSGNGISEQRSSAAGRGL